jgi:hypothetical protein
MTFLNRRRLVRLVFLFCENAIFPFCMGIVLSLMIWTHTLLDTFTTLDKSGFSVCVLDKGQGGNQ